MFFVSFAFNLLKSWEKMETIYSILKSKVYVRQCDTKSEYLQKYKVYINWR